MRVVLPLKMFFRRHFELITTQLWSEPNVASNLATTRGSGYFRCLGNYTEQSLETETTIVRPRIIFVASEQRPFDAPREHVVTF
jgi:hypothetical protein